MDAFVLGAGFSIATDPINMPTTNQLGHQVISIQKKIHQSPLRRHSDNCDGLSCDRPVLFDNKYPAANFEEWLSRLAEPQPYLSEPDNDMNHALFTKLTGLIALYVQGAQESTCQSDVPTWLEQLVVAWHERRVEVVTFNYDTLIEATVDRIQLATDDAQPRPISYDKIGPRVIPMWDGVSYYGGGRRAPPANSFRYRKLHGSVNWYWDAVTRAADSIIDVGLAHSWGQSAGNFTDEELRQYRAPGKTPLIVPPTATKSGSFDNPVIQFLWRDAFMALRGAKRVFVLGYSLPPSDLLVRGMFTEALRGSIAYIVNPDGEVGARFRELGVRDVDLTFSGSANPVPEFAAAYSAGL
jgi:hypothetical protein